MYTDDHHNWALSDFHAPINYEQGYSSDQQKNMASTSNFLSTYDYMSLLESGLYKKSYNDTGDSSHLHQAKAAKSIDPRLLILLGYFKELYVRKRELFKKIFPGIFHNEFTEYFRKIGGVLSQVKTQKREVKTMRRSLSLGSRRTRAIGGGVQPLRPDRFKIRTVVVDGDGQGGSGGGQGGQGDTKSSNYK